MVCEGKAYPPIPGLDVNNIPDINRTYASVTISC